MAKVISQFFSDLGFPLKNVRWSWGARSGNAILLRTWDDELSFKERKLRVMGISDVNPDSESYGLDERLVQLKALWEGGIAGYTVIATAKDKNATPREIASYRDDAVFTLSQLVQNPNGDIFAVIGLPVPTSELSDHLRTYVTAAGDGLFPIGDAQRSGLSTDSYKDKIPAIREWLIEVSHRRETVTYSDVMDRFGLTFFPLQHALSRLGQDCQGASEPIITALVVDKNTRRCSDGLYSEFRVDDDERERERCYAHWAISNSSSSADQETAKIANQSDAHDDIELRATRFAQAQTRPEQGRFREAVFRACHGKCVVSGCQIPEALEAAHLFGRDWRKGHNCASDGILLRRDLHSLYDRGLLQINESGVVELVGDALAYYKEFSGISVSLS